MKRTLTAILLLLLVLTARAQGNVEYRMEIGAGAGMMAYEGDFNGSITKQMKPVGMALWRYNFNPYMGLRTAFSMGKIEGSSANVDTYYPELQNNPYEFSNTLYDLSVTYEYNFWPYGTGLEYRGAKRLTPFVFGGIGATYATGGDKNTFTANIPLGLGVKYKIADRVNVGLEWAIHFSLSDELDGMKDPYTVKSSGAFKNTDCYSALQLTVSYSFSAKCRTCHNSDE